MGETSHSERALASVRRMIVSGDLAPGQVISDQHLASKLGMSRTPVREALRQLADEGLVVVWPRAATRIAPVDHDALPSIYELIGALLGVATRRGVPILPSIDTGGLQKLRIAGGLDHQYRLADLLVATARMPLLTRAITAPAAHARRAEILLGSSLPAQVRRPPEFTRLRDACVAGDEVAAGRLVAEALERRAVLMHEAWAARSSEAD